MVFGRNIGTLLAFLVVGLVRIQAFTARGSCQSSPLIWLSSLKPLMPPVGGIHRINLGISATAIYGKKEARAEGNESKRKKERPKKVKDDVIEVEGVVLESLPNAMFRCTIDGAPETQPPILATISGKIRKNFVKILVGDKVLIELSPYDLTRGRITFRYR